MPLQVVAWNVFGPAGFEKLPAFKQIRSPTDICTNLKACPRQTPLPRDRRSYRFNSSHQPSTALPRRADRPLLVAAADVEDHHNNHLDQGHTSVPEYQVDW